MADPIVSNKRKEINRCYLCNSPVPEKFNASKEKIDALIKVGAALANSTLDIKETLYREFPYLINSDKANTIIENMLNLDSVWYYVIKS